jgi:Domain of unknown function (DUF4389)
MEPPRQRRWTVLLRIFLAIPLFFAGIGVALAALVWVIGAWFSAVFTGLVPAGLHRKLLGALRFQLRLSAYLGLLTDVWPGVHFEHHPGDAITVNVDQVELRRSAVFFRVFLAIPAFFVSSLVSSGQAPLVFVMWIMGMVRGRTPVTLHQTVALALRYSARTTAFGLLLTPTQPFRGFFGDEDTGEAPATSSDVVAPASNTPLDDAPSPLPTRWVVPTAVKVWLIVFLVLGLGGQIQQRTTSMGVWSVFGTLSDRSVVETSMKATTSVITQFGHKASPCTQTTCLQTQANFAATQEAQIIQTFYANYRPDPAAHTQYAAYRDQLLVVAGVLAEFSIGQHSVASDRALVTTLLANYVTLSNDATALENAL